MKKQLMLGLVLAFLFVSVPVFATVTDVSTSASTTRVTTGTSVTISASVTSSTTETTSLQLVSSPSGITVSDPAGGSYSSVSVSTTPTTKTFTITAGTAGTYTYYAQAGSPPVTSTPASIVFENPAVFTVSGTPSTTTQSAGGTFTLSVTITNTQASSITSSYALSLPSGYSASGDATSGTATVGAGSSSTFSWTVTAGSSSGTIYFQLGDNTNAFSSAVTISSTSTAAAGGGGGAAAGVSSKSVDLKSKFAAADTYQSTFSKDDKAVYEFAGENHSIKVVQVTNTTVTLTIASTPYNITLSIGETKNIDLDGDGTNDLAITLNSISNLVANLTFKSLVPAAVPAPAETTPPTPSTPEAPTVTGAALTAPAAAPFDWTPIIAGAAVLIIAAGGAYLYRKGKKPAYRARK